MQLSHSEEAVAATVISASMLTAASVDIIGSSLCAPLSSSSLPMPQAEPSSDLPSSAFSLHPPRCRCVIRS